MNIRYEGILYTIDPVKATVALQNVRCFGTEGRTNTPDQEVPASPQIYRFLIFGGNDIKDLHVSDPPAASPPPATETGQARSPPQQPPVSQPPLPQAQPVQQPQASQPKPPQQERGTQKQPQNNRPADNNKPQARSGQQQHQQQQQQQRQQQKPAQQQRQQQNGQGSQAGGGVGGGGGAAAGGTTDPNAVPGTGGFLSKGLNASAAKATPKMEDFDFVSSNQNYDKDAYIKSLVADAKKKKEGEAATADAPEGTDGPAPSADLDSLLQSLGGMELGEADKPVIAPKYDKKKSFFDDITTDADVRNTREDEANDEDADTFGEAAKGYRSRHNRYGGGGRRGGGRRRGGGGGGRGGGGGYRRRRGGPAPQAVPA
eukprot:g29914.t1